MLRERIMYLQPRNHELIKKTEKNRTLDNSWFEDRVGRIIKIMGSDPGVFVLSVHSFVEGYIRETYGLEDTEYKFYDLIQYLHDDLKKRRNTWIPELGILGDFRLAQDSTNRVRHRFDALEKIDAAEASHRFHRFCTMMALPIEKYLSKFEEATKLWDRPGDRLSDVQELNQKGFHLQQARQNQEKTNKELEQYHTIKAEKEALERKIILLERSQEEAAENQSSKSDKVEALRRERFDLKEKNRELSFKLDSLKHASAYMSEMRSLIAYTRTRSDYERSVLKLTKEQLRILDQVSLKEDFLIKGGAGTGKTLILLKALEKALITDSQELSLAEKPVSVALLTYTRTLARYDHYIARIMALSDIGSSIETSDAFLFNRFQKLGLGVIHLSLIDEIISRENSLDFMNNEELKNEIEGFIFGSMISKQEYLDEMIPRLGRRRPLSDTQRKEIWNIAESVMDSMMVQGVFSKQYACRLLAESTPEVEQKVDFIFIDEVQDLTTAELKALKKHAQRGVVLAGDADQAIYQTVFPIKRSDINIQGHTRILRTNFRNTIQIQEFAEKYRKLHPELGFDEENQPEAFRSGPSVEITRNDSQKESLRALTERVDILVNEFYYEPENICILCPDKNLINIIQKQLGTHGYKSYNIRESDFSFTEREVIRLSTLHSAKGLEFPVVLLYMDKMPYVGEGHSSEELLKLQRHLMYVAVSRPMDYLHIFISGKDIQDDLNDLVLIRDS
jgi:hypothetical protein